MSRTESLLGQPTRPDGQHALQRFRYSRFGMEIELRFSALGTVHPCTRAVPVSAWREMCIDLLSLHPSDANAADILETSPRPTGWRTVLNHFSRDSFHRI